MKHVLTVIACLASLAGVSLPLASDYQSHKSLQQEQTAASQAAAHSAATRQASFNAGVKQLEAQCAKDKAAYAALPLAVQAKSPAPVCPTNLVQ